MRRSKLALLVLLLSATAAEAQQTPIGERGFKPEMVYDFNGFDTVNLGNGNLMAAISLGQSYPVSENLSYRFALRYTGIVWHETRRPDETGNPDGAKVFYTPRSGDNAGLGWRLSFGELYEGSSIDPEEMTTAVFRWRYVTPDGGNTSSGTRCTSRAARVRRQRTVTSIRKAFRTRATTRISG